MSWHAWRTPCRSAVLRSWRRGQWVHGVRRVRMAVPLGTNSSLCSPWHSSVAYHSTQENGDRNNNAEAGKRDDDTRAALFVTNVGAGVNLGLAGAKALAGWLAVSPALIADAVHSLSDLASDAVTAVTVYYSRRPADDSHPYGHGKIETLGALSVSAFLIAGGCGIGYHSYLHLVDMLPLLDQVFDGSSTTAGDASPVSASTALSSSVALAVAVAGVSVVAKELLFRWTLKVGGVGARLVGLDFLDPIAGILVGAMIIKAGASIGLESLQELTDQSMDKELLDEVSAEVECFPEVLALSTLRTRHMGHYVLVDMEIEVDPALSVSAAHQVGVHVRRTVLAKWPKVSEVLIGISAHESDAARGKGAVLDPDNVFRSVPEIESEVRAAALSVPRVEGLSHVRLHFIKRRVAVEMEIYVDMAMSVACASKIAKGVRVAVEQIPEVSAVDVHLELSHDALHGLETL